MKKFITCVLCTFFIVISLSGCASYNDVKQSQIPQRVQYRFSKIASWDENGYTIVALCDNETGVVYVRYGQYISSHLVDRDGKPLTIDNWLNPYPNETNTNTSQTTSGTNVDNAKIENNITINNN